MRFIYILKRQVVVFKGETVNYSQLLFGNRGNAEKALTEWNAKMKNAAYAEFFHGYIETAELEDAE